jgi:uncharacterized membrane protein YidH (DUF202 family)
MKPIFIAYYAIALFFPVLFFTVFTDNSNERHPGAVWVMCIVLMGAAGYMSSKWALAKGTKRSTENSFKWIGVSVVVGIVEAILLTAGV